MSAHNRPQLTQFIADAAKLHTIPARPTAFSGTNMLQS